MGASFSTAAILVRPDELVIADENITCHHLPRQLATKELARGLTARRILPDKEVVLIDPGRRIQVPLFEDVTRLTVITVSPAEAIMTWLSWSNPSAKQRIAVVTLTDYPTGGGKLTYWLPNGQQNECGMQDNEPLSRKGYTVGTLIAGWLSRQQPNISTLALWIAMGPTPGAISLDDPPFAERCQRILGDNWREHIIIYPTPREVLHGALLAART